MTPTGEVLPAGEPSEGPGLVDWAMAQRVAEWIVSRRPLPPSYRAQAVQADFDEATARAEEMVATATGLRSAIGPARGRVTDRAGWARANVASLRRLLDPTLRRVAERRAQSAFALPSWAPARLAGAGRSVSGAQLGAVLAWMSTRVLGQYDLLITDGVSDDQDIVYYVGPNVVQMESRYDFPPEQFRLWLALHEVTHRCQFTGVPWLRDHFLSLIDKGLEPIGADPRRLLDGVRRAATDIRAGRSPLEDVGMIGLVATPEQLEVLHRIQALMSLLEGHGDVTMDRAGAAAIPEAARFSRVLRERRQQAKGAARVLQQVLGLEAKLRQYAEGEAFVSSVEEIGGPALLDQVWRGPEWLPSLQEIREPRLWVDRVGEPPAASA